MVFFWTDHGMRLPRHKQWLYEGWHPRAARRGGPGPCRAVRPGADLVSGIDITVTTLALAGMKTPGLDGGGRDFFAPDHEARDHVVSARDRCDYTIDRVPRGHHQAIQVPAELPDRPTPSCSYSTATGRDYVEVPRELYKAGKLNGRAVLHVVANAGARGVLRPRQRPPRDGQSGERPGTRRRAWCGTGSCCKTGSRPLTTRASTPSRLTACAAS